MKQTVEKIAIVLGNADFNHDKAMTGLYEPGQLLERITLFICRRMRLTTILSSTSGNITENHIADIQHETPEKPSGHSSHTSPAAPSTTTSNTSRNSSQHPILFHDRHKGLTGNLSSSTVDDQCFSDHLSGNDGLDVVRGR